MRYCTQTLFGDQFSCYTIYTVCFIFYSNQCSFKPLDKFLLTICHLHQIFLRLRCTAFLKRLICRGCVIDIITIGIHELFHHSTLITTRKT